MMRKYLLIIMCVGLVLISCLAAARVWSPALSAVAACRQTMEHTDGYGPWHAQAAPAVANLPANAAVLAYDDGVNTASCYTRRYGPIWVVVGVGQTLVGCGRGLAAGQAQGCPRGTYGVIP